MSDDPQDTTGPDETTFGLPVPKDPPGSGGWRSDDEDDDGQHPTIEVISTGDVVRRDLDRDVRSIRGLEIRDRIGRGSFGVVYQAWDPELGTERAVKILRRDLLEEDERRFAREGRLLAALDHPSIARVHQTGVTAGGRPYIVMDFIRGLPITQFADEHKLNLDDRVKLMIAVCGAVQHAHARGIIHRDLKPENILVERHEGGAVPKVIDFGIAKVVAAPTVSSQEPTRLGMVLGTYPYMSPEQADPSILDVDVTADVHALGVVLYELLTGLLPRDPSLLDGRAELSNLRSAYRTPPVNPTRRLSDEASRDADTVVARITSPRRTDLSGLLRGLRGDLETIAMHCIDSDRSERYPTADALATDLRRFLEGMPLLRGPRTPLYRAKKFVRRHRASVIGTLVVALVIVGLSITSVVFGIRAGLDRERAEAAALAAREQSARSEQLARMLGVIHGLPRAMIGATSQGTAGERLFELLLDRTPPADGQREALAGLLEGVATTEVARQLLLETVLRPAAETIVGALESGDLVLESREAGLLLAEVSDRFVALGDSDAALRYALLARDGLAEAPDTEVADELVVNELIVTAGVRASNAVVVDGEPVDPADLVADARDRMRELDPEMSTVPSIRARIHELHRVTAGGERLDDAVVRDLVAESTERFGPNARETASAIALQAAQSALAARSAADDATRARLYGEAAALGRDALDRLERSGPDVVADAILVRGNLATYLSRTRDRGAREEAVELADAALVGARREFGDLDPRTLEILSHRSYAIWALSDTLDESDPRRRSLQEDSTETYRQQWLGRAGAFGPRANPTLRALANHVDGLITLGRLGEARARVTEHAKYLEQFEARPAAKDPAHRGVALLFKGRGRLAYLEALGSQDAAVRRVLLEASIADLARAVAMMDDDSGACRQAGEWLAESEAAR